jgi:hypothetical protein
VHIDSATGTMWLFTTHNCCNPAAQHRVNIATSTDGGYNFTQVLQTPLARCVSPLLSPGGRCLACPCRCLPAALYLATASCGRRAA